MLWDSSSRPLQSNLSDKPEVAQARVVSLQTQPC